jgi:hypothetical protein
LAEGLLFNTGTAEGIGFTAESAKRERWADGVRYHAARRTVHPSNEFERRK